MYDVTRDGQKFQINTNAKQADTMPLSVVLNWTAQLKRNKSGDGRSAW